MTHYDITNPTKGARVIYNGIPDSNKRQKEIFIAPGDTKTDVELSDSIAEELIERTKGDGKHDADLRLRPSARQPEKAQPQSNKK